MPLRKILIFNGYVVYVDRGVVYWPAIINIVYGEKYVLILSPVFINIINIFVLILKKTFALFKVTPSVNKFGLYQNCSAGNYL